MNDLIAALGLMLVIEGVLYAAFPDFMRRAMAQVLALADEQIRGAALGTACLGLLLVWFVRG